MDQEKVLSAARRVAGHKEEKPKQAAQPELKSALKSKTKSSGSGLQVEFDA